MTRIENSPIRNDESGIDLGLENDTSEFHFNLDRESLTRPLMWRAGILDLNRLKELIQQGKGIDLLNRNRLLSLTDQEFFRALENLGDPVLTDIVRRNAMFGRTPPFFGRLVERGGLVRQLHSARIPLNIKAGLESLALSEGRTMTLEEWLRSNEELLSSMSVSNGIERFKGKDLIIF